MVVERDIVHGYRPGVARPGSPVRDDTRPIEFVDREDYIYHCPNGHQTTVTFAATVATSTAGVPDMWDCRHCNDRAALDPDVARTVDPDLHGPAFPGSWATTFHLRALHQRRTTEQLEALLDDAISRRRNRVRAA